MDKHLWRPIYVGHDFLDHKICSTNFQCNQTYKSLNKYATDKNCCVFCMEIAANAYSSTLIIFTCPTSSCATVTCIRVSGTYYLKPKNRIEICSFLNKKIMQKKHGFCVDKKMKSYVRCVVVRIVLLDHTHDAGGVLAWEVFDVHEREGQDLYELIADVWLSC